jgi:hypothetical protein
MLFSQNPASPKRDLKIRSLETEAFLEVNNYGVEIERPNSTYGNHIVPLQIPKSSGPSLFI